jgi:CRP/FNR family cyclic AMP-dependent transcriptional regulator
MSSELTQNGALEVNEQNGVLDLARRLPFISLFFRRLDAQQKEILSLLKKTTIFCDLTQGELTDLLNILHVRTFAPGEKVFSEGEPGLGLYVILRGEVEIGKLDQEGKGRLARLGTGDVFGEVSFLDGSGRSAPAAACAKTELIGFYRTELLQLLDRKPVLASKILFSLAKQMGMRLRATLQMVPS